MSIFPKRTRRGTSVTIHWNFNAARLTHTHLMPFARIGVRAPDGQLTMLHEGHVLALPAPPVSVPTPPETTARTLPKSVPLLVLASYLSGRHQREELADMLRGIDTGRHYYFTYPVPSDAPLGRYTLVSELYTEGRLQHSGTAADDFFLVEELQIDPGTSTLAGGQLALVHNPGPEPVPVRVVDYDPARKPTTTSYLREVPAHATLVVESGAGACGFVLYNEEREVLPLVTTPEPTFLRNQQLLTLEKEVDGEPTTFVLTGDTGEAYELTGDSRTVWNRADGLSTPQQLADPALRAAYAQLLAEGLIQELPR